MPNSSRRGGSEGGSLLDFVGEDTLKSTGILKSKCGGKNISGRQGEKEGEKFPVLPANVPQGNSMAKSEGYLPCWSLEKPLSPHSPNDISCNRHVCIGLMQTLELKQPVFTCIKSNIGRNYSELSTEGKILLTKLFCCLIPSKGSVHLYGSPISVSISRTCCSSTLFCSHSNNKRMFCIVQRLHESAKDSEQCVLQRSVVICLQPFHYLFCWACFIWSTKFLK